MDEDYISIMIDLLAEIRNSLGFDSPFRLCFDTYISEYFKNKQVDKEHMIKWLVVEVENDPVIIKYTDFEYKMIDGLLYIYFSFKNDIQLFNKIYKRISQKFTEQILLTSGTTYRNWKRYPLNHKKMIDLTYLMDSYLEYEDIKLLSKIFGNGICRKFITYSLKKVEANLKTNLTEKNYIFSIDEIEGITYLTLNPYK
jgi:hypothetical protein